MKFTDAELIDRIPKHDLRAVSRLITLVENAVPRARGVQSALFKKTGKAHIIGVTGAPGAGKSTLVDELALLFRRRGSRVGILAVDPTSPFSGGAILGDRIRMNKVSEDPEVFIRSMATRGSLGGISRTTLDAIQILDSAGFDVIIVETVGVGQAEVDIVRTADTCVVVLVPGMGDSVQAIKAGILEIADVFVINKADRDGADILHKDLRVMLTLGEHPEEGAWTPKICSTVAIRGEGVTELVDSIVEHKSWLGSTEEGKKRKIRVLKDMILKVATEIVAERVLSSTTRDLDSQVLECFERKTDPYTIALELVKTLSA